ncbi:MAG: C39 family peptidase [Patescibacteria group bacterium]|jgi:hypothetical protein
MKKNDKEGAFSLRLIIFGIILLISALILLYPKIDIEDKKSENTEAEISQSSLEKNLGETQITASEDKPLEIPSKKVLSMSFASQAPSGDWSEPWQNACEEASIDIVRYYLNEKTLSKESMRDDILSMVDWQMKNWGGHYDLTAEKTLILAQNVYGLSGEVLSDYSVDSIKRLIASGVPVIVPTDGRLLGNPNFTNGGPEYHMLVIKGYDSAGFITNDPGTRKGEGYYYLYQTVLESVKNPDGGQKELLIVTK